MSYSMSYEHFSFDFGKENRGIREGGRSKEEKRGGDLRSYSLD
jgi:hypothetical protein